MKLKMVALTIGATLQEMEEEEELDGAFECEWNELNMYDAI